MYQETMKRIIDEFIIRGSSWPWITHLSQFSQKNKFELIFRSISKNCEQTVTKLTRKFIKSISDLVKG